MVLLAILLTVPTTSNAWELRIATEGAPRYAVLATVPTESDCKADRGGMLHAFLSTMPGEPYLAACMPVHSLRPYIRSHR